MRKEIVRGQDKDRVGHGKLDNRNYLQKRYIRQNLMFGKNAERFGHQKISLYLNC